MGNSLKKKIKFWSSFSKRLLFIVCITVIPVNILAVIVSSIVIMESRDSITASYKNELDIYMSNKVSLINKLDERFFDFIKENLDTMTVHGGSNAILSINMAQELGNILNAYDIQGFTYLWEQQEDGRLYMKGNKKKYSHGEVEKLKQELWASKEKEAGTSSWHIVFLNGRYFYFNNYSYTNYKVGFGIDLQAELKELLEQKLHKSLFLLLKSGDSILLMSPDGTAEMISGTEADHYLTSGLNKNIITWNSNTLKNEMEISIASEGFWKSVPAVYWMLQILALFGIAGIVILWKMIRKQVIYPLVVLHKGMKKLEENALQYRINEKAETNEFKYLFDAFNRMADDILRSHERDIQMYQIEITNLRLQVNPHMLLNSFNMIYSLAQTRNYQCIQEYSMHLVEYFRYVLKENETLVPLASEMKFVTSFIEIQKIRFPGEFTSVYNMEDGLSNALVPPLIIENFVENAMKYARKLNQAVEILINIRKENEKLLISICDTGKGMEKEVLEILKKGEIYIDNNGQKHIGIWNCRRRLESFFGDAAVLNITSVKGEGTQVWMELPYMEKEAEQLLGRWNQPLTKDIQQGEGRNEPIDC